MGDEPPHGRQARLTDNADDQRRVLDDASLRTTQTMEFASFPAQVVGGPAQYEHNPSLFNMSNMATALPDYQYQTYGQQSPPQQLLSLPNRNMFYQVQQNAHLAGQNAPQFNPVIQQHFPMAGSQLPSHGRGTNLPYSQFGPATQFSQPLLQQAGLQNVQSQYQTQPAQFYQQPPTANFGQVYNMRATAGPSLSQGRFDGTSGPINAFPGLPGLPRYSSRPGANPSALVASVPRGPPRKPKQSGHALWVGNLPPGTHIIDLKDHFSRDATTDIESLFLISKSNCAFVNYKTEDSCTAAMARFHDSRFQGVRLVCRLRRGTTPTSAMQLPGTTEQLEIESKELSEESGNAQASAATKTSPNFVPDAESRGEKYFIVKSLTIDDLEMSKITGTWATQAHNEVVLNKAFQSTDNVYLIFSANKSGEYYGYARMTSSIDDEPVATPQQPQRQEVRQPSPSEAPLTIHTPATATAPSGHIIDDSARGTIFWEAEVEAVEGERTEPSGHTTAAESEDANVLGQTVFGKPFRIEWLSTDRLPFYRTRGLRNPWNSNREVKIARDGTELEPSVGRRLVSMFHRSQIPSTAVSSNYARMSQQVQSQQGVYPHPPC